MKPRLLLNISVFALFFTATTYASAPIEDLSTETATNHTQTTTITTSSHPVNYSHETVEQRITRLEQQADYFNKNNPQKQIEVLQQKIQTLNGDLETQQHKLAQLEKQLNDFYTDLDQRLKTQSEQIKDNASHETTNTTNNNKKQTPHHQSPNKNTTKKTISHVTKNLDKTNHLATNQQTSTSKNSTTTKKDLTLQEQQTYQAALNDLRNKNFTSGSQKLKTYLGSYPHGIYSANAHYWLGEIYFLNSSLTQASNEFNTVVTKYPTSSKIPEAMFKLAYIHDKQGKHEQAQKEYNIVKKRYPNSSAAKLAEQQLK